MSHCIRDTKILRDERASIPRRLQVASNARESNQKRTLKAGLLIAGSRFAPFRLTEYFYLEIHLTSWVIVPIMHAFEEPPPVCACRALLSNHRTGE